MMYAGIAAMALGAGLIVLLVDNPIFPAIVATLSVILGIVMLMTALGS